MDLCSCERLYPDAEYLKTMYPNTLTPVMKRLPIPVTGWNTKAVRCLMIFRIGK